jgi:hypothetical protein
MRYECYVRCISRYNLARHLALKSAKTGSSVGYLCYKGQKAEENRQANSVCDLKPLAHEALS